MRKAVIGLLLGLAGGVLAAILLAPRRRGGDSTAAIADRMVGAGESVADGVQSLWKRWGSGEQMEGLLPDERVSLRVRDELERRGMWRPGLDVTTVDGTVYLRGKEPDATRIEALVGAVREVDGVREVAEELRRE